MYFIWFFFSFLIFSFNIFSSYKAGWQRLAAIHLYLLPFSSILEVRRWRLSLFVVYILDGEEGLPRVFLLSIVHSITLARSPLCRNTCPMNFVHLLFGIFRKLSNLQLLFQIPPHSFHQADLKYSPPIPCLKTQYSFFSTVSPTVPRCHFHKVLYSYEQFAFGF